MVLKKPLRIPQIATCKKPEVCRKEEKSYRTGKAKGYIVRCSIKSDLDILGQHFCENVAMAMGLVFVAMTQQGHVTLLSEFL